MHDYDESTNPDYVSTDDTITYCMQVEASFQNNILKSPGPYLSLATQTINEIEQGDMCYGQANITLSLENCLNITDQI